MSRRVVDQYLSLPEQNKYLAALVAWMGFPQTSINVAHQKSSVGKSRYNYFQLVNMWINLVLPFSSYPLRVITWTGLVMSIVSLVLVLGTVIL